MIVYCIFVYFQCHAVHRTLVANFKYALVWVGNSLSHLCWINS